MIYEVIFSNLIYAYMSLFGFLLLLLIAAICGGIGQAIAGYDVGGCLVSIIVGFVGAWIGMYIAARFNLPMIFEINIDGKPFPVVWSVIGAVIFVFIIALLRRAFVGNR